MKKLLVLLLIMPSILYAGDLDLTFSTRGNVDKGEAVLTLNKHVELFYEEEHNHENGTIETTKGVTFSFSFDLKKGDK